MANCSINGRAIQFMVDTGATSVALGISDAQRLGIDYKRACPFALAQLTGWLKASVSCSVQCAWAR